MPLKAFHYLKLRHVPEKTKLFGQTHWLHTAEKFPVSGNFHPVEVEPSWGDAKSDFYDVLKEARSLRFTLKKQCSSNLDQPIQDLRETLPTKVVCDELIASYLRSLEPLYRIIHVPSFRKEYDRLWDSESISSLPTVSMVRLTLIMAIGTTFARFDSDAEINHFWRLAQSWIQNAQWWLTGPNEKTTYNLEGLQVFCLLILARQTTFNCRGATSWLSSGSLLRAACTMGLHRDPRLFSGLSLFQKELRARLWATVLELAVQSCLDLGLPLHLSEEDFDAPTPSNFNDIDLESSSPQTPKSMDNFTDSYLQILLSKSLPLRVRVIRFLNDIRQGKTHEKALAIGTQLRAECRDVATFFRSVSQGQANLGHGSNLGANEFHRKLIDIHLRRFILFLHRDFMLQAQTNPQFYLSRKLCVEAALVIASGSKGIDLDLPLRVWDDMSRLSFVGRGLFKCALSFDAMLILALAVISELQDESTPDHESDILKEMARTARAPLIQTLEEISKQLRCLIARGNLSLKRLLFSKAHLEHIRALEAGRPVKAVVYETVTSTLRDCVEMMLEVQATMAPNESVVTSDSLNTDFFGPDMFFDNNIMEWDISDLLGFPTIGKEGNWPVMD
ncbi:transcriptional regulatory [Fusarium sporotrichioides]|uniref:Transcriptional regulatory n=1 Tax=Fusarium sporotrichioides TaxID=5514 RepID=A0A395SDZ9_FUSSP|nr:transcriptional regulatory [Fusarium sporotrichioides]